MHVQADFLKGEIAWVLAIDTTATTTKKEIIIVIGI
jgi:hypothetical protein